MTLLLLAPLIAVLVIGGAAGVLQLQRRNQRRLIGAVVELQTWERPRLAHEPWLLYFTGVHCTVCHVAQRPALRTLQDRVGSGLRIREVDVADEPDLARKYRVLSLPTTIVLRADNSVSAVNTGFAGAEVLARQLVDAGLLTAELASA